MGRYLIPVTICGVILTPLWLAIFLWIPPVNGWVVTGFLVTGGLMLAAWGALGIYYLRRIWGPKESPRYLLRQSLKQGFFLSLGVAGFLLLGLFGATNLVTIAIVLGLVFMMERLT